jgi:hypothetical protein
MWQHCDRSRTSRREVASRASQRSEQRGTIRRGVVTRTRSGHGGGARVEGSSGRCRRDGRGQRTCCRSVGVLRRSRASSTLIRGLTDASAEVQFWCAFALGEVRGPAAVPALRALSRSQRIVRGRGAVRQEALSAIHAIRSGQRNDGHRVRLRRPRHGTRSGAVEAPVLNRSCGAIDEPPLLEKLDGCRSARYESAATRDNAVATRDNAVATRDNAAAADTDAPARDTAAVTRDNGAVTGGRGAFGIRTLLSRGEDRAYRSRTAPIQIRTPSFGRRCIQVGNRVDPCRI